LLTDEPNSPEDPEGLFYLVRGVNGRGAGTWGFASDGDERQSAGCP